MPFTLTQKHNDLCIAKIPPSEKIEIPHGDFVCILKTDGEQTLITHAHCVPPNIKDVNCDWTGFMVEGPLDFSLTGIMANLSASLARAKISLFALSTYDTDWILVKNADSASAREAWGRDGHTIHAL